MEVGTYPELWRKHRRISKARPIQFWAKEHPPHIVGRTTMIPVQFFDDPGVWYVAPSRSVRDFDYELLGPFDNLIAAVRLCVTLRLLDSE